MNKGENSPETGLTGADFDSITQAQKKPKVQVEKTSAAASEVLENKGIYDLFSKYISSFIKNPDNRFKGELRDLFIKERYSFTNKLLSSLKTELNGNEKMELTRVYLEALEGEHFDFFDESIRNKIKDIVFEFLSLVTEKDNDGKIFFKSSKLVSGKIDIELNEFEKLQGYIAELLNYEEVKEALKAS